MVKETSVRVGVDCKKCFVEGAEGQEYFPEHGCDFMVTKMFDEQQASSLLTAPDEAKFMGMSSVHDHLTTMKWSHFVVGRVHVPQELESEDPGLSNRAEQIVKEQIEWINFLALPALMVKLEEKHQNLSRILVRVMNKTIDENPIWCDLPVVMKADDDENGAVKSWRIWDSMRIASDHRTKLELALRLTEDVPSEYEVDYQRWAGEPVKAIIIPSHLFTLNKGGYPCLLKAHQNLIAKLAHLDPYIIIEQDGCPDDLHYKTAYIKEGLWNKVYKSDSIRDAAKGFEDHLQTPLQPLMDNLESATYEIFERDPIKYELYREAVEKALKKKNLTTTIVFMLGAGRGPIVDKIIEAAKNVDKEIELYAIEKNTSAINILNQKNNQLWKGKVTIISSDMRTWQPPFKADIIVSELLGSFGDNELSPECLIGANHLLKEDAISVPVWYTSYLAPISSETLYRQVRRGRRTHVPQAYAYETPYVVQMHNKFVVGTAKEVFSYSHPKATMKGGNALEQKAEVKWKMKTEARIHGFAGYFHCCLYDDVFMSITPKLQTPEMFSWYPVFFPIEQPIHMRQGETLSMIIWRCARRTDDTRWYEWRVTGPTCSRIHNPDGRASTIGCQS